MLIYHLSELGRAVFSRLPSFICYPLASLTGDILYRRWGRGRYYMRQNVAAVMKREVDCPKVNNITRRCFRNICKYVMDFARFSGVKDIREKGVFTVTGLEKVDSALEEGRGAILVGFHVGSWDLGARLLHQMGYKVSAVAGTLDFGSRDNGQVDRFFRKWRTRTDMRTIMVQDGFNKMLGTLRRNELLAILVDCPKYTTGIEVSFSDRLATVPPGAALLALRSRARVIPCCIVRDFKNHFNSIFYDPIDYQPSGELRRDMVDLTQLIVNASEKMVRQFTDQWFMFQPFVKNRFRSGL